MKGMFSVVSMAALLLIFGSGCALLNLGVSQAITPPPTIVAPAVQVTTPIPTQPSSLPAPTTTALEPVAVPSLPAPDRPAPTQPGQPAGPINALPPASPGPESLDLSSPTLYRSPLSDYSAVFSDQVEGTAPDGSPAVIITRYSVRLQTQPAAAWSASNSMFDDTTRVDTVALQGTLYTATADGECTTGAPGAPPGSPVAALAGTLTGQAQRTAEGVEVNGLLADQYAIAADNLAPSGELKLVQSASDGESSSTSTLTVQLHGTGSLYLAQQGGFIVRLELSDESKATEREFFFQPGSDMFSQTVVELVPTQPEDAPITYPAGCGGETEASGQAAEPGGGDADPSSLPRPADAQIVNESDGSLIYQSVTPTDQLDAFYRSEMAARGYALDSANQVGPIVNLIFSKDGQTVTITMLPTGDTVTVTVTQG